MEHEQDIPDTTAESDASETAPAAEAHDGSTVAVIAEESAARVKTHVRDAGGPGGWRVW